MNQPGAQIMVPHWLNAVQELNAVQWQSCSDLHPTCIVTSKLPRLISCLTGVLRPTGRSLLVLKHGTLNPSILAQAFSSCTFRSQDSRSSYSKTTPRGRSLLEKWRKIDHQQVQFRHPPTMPSLTPWSKLRRWDNGNHGHILPLVLRHWNMGELGEPM